MLADHVERHEVELALQRPAGLAEEVAQDRRQQRGGRPGVPGEAALGLDAQGPAEGGRPLQQRDVVAQLRQPHRRGEPAEAPTDHHDARHGANTSHGRGADGQRRSGAGSSRPKSEPYSASTNDSRAAFTVREPVAGAQRHARVDLGEEAGRGVRDEQRVAGLLLGTGERGAVPADGEREAAADLRTLGERDRLPGARGVHQRHQALEVGDREPGVDAGHEVGLEQREEPAVDLADRGDARRHPGVELGGPEPLGGEHAVDAERAPVAVLALQVRAHPAYGGPHRLAVGRGRVPRRAEPAVDEPALLDVAQHGDLDGPERGRAVGQHHAVDRAGHAVEERHHPHPVAARREEGERRRPVVLVADPAHVVAAAVEAAAGVTRPDGAERAGDLRGRLGQRVLVDRDDAVRRGRHVGGRPDGVGQHLVLEREEGRGPASGDRTTQDRLVIGDEGAGVPDPGALGVEGLDGCDRGQRQVVGQPVVESAARR